MTYILHKNHPDRDQVKANAHAFIDRLPVGKSFTIEVREYHKPRSLDQNAALWAAAYKPIMEYMGLRGEDDRKALHRFFCSEYFGRKSCTFGGIPIRTTTKNERGERDPIDTVTMMDLYAFIQQRAAEQGIDVPDPDPFWKDKAA